MAIGLGKVGRLGFIGLSPTALTKGGYAPPGYALLRGADGAYLKGADGAYLYGKVS